jgi:hypothetical protein
MACHIQERVRWEIRLEIHDHRSRFDRAVKHAYSRASGARNEIAADLQSEGSISRWALLVVLLGGVATVFWALLLAWLAFDLVAGLMGLIWG